MNQLLQYFSKNLKKRDLSDGSKTGDDDFKKPREGNSGSKTQDFHTFQEDAESAECQKVLFNNLKNLEQ